MASTVQVILQQDLKNLGKSGELVRVRPGYARNYLVPRALAVPATTDNVARIEHEKRISAVKAAKTRSEATTVAERLGKVTLRFARKVGDENRLFGSVTTKEIESALKEQGIDVDRKRLALPEPIRQTGTFEVTAKLLSDVNVTFKIEVVPEG
jgi:large subunit ribosomal protein L9